MAVILRGYMEDLINYDKAARFSPPVGKIFWDGF